MKSRVIVSLLVVPAVLSVVANTAVFAQVSFGTKSFDPKAVQTDAAIQAAAEASAKAEAAAANWKAPHTPWGDPDLRGYYVTATYTPLERPAELAEKPFYTQEEAVAAFKKAVENDAQAHPSVVHYDWKEYGMEAWQSPVRPNRRTSLIFDPENGRLPPYTEEAKKRMADARAAARARNPNVSVSTLDNWYTRCISGLGTGPMVQGGSDKSVNAAETAGVTSEAQFFQSPGYVVLITQSDSDARIIPLDRSPHLSSEVRTWLGDARGHWEGDTLVVESTNYIQPGRYFMGATANTKLTERFSMVGPNTMRYSFTMDDPATWTRPWSAETFYPRIEPPLYEFACHEENYGLINLVRGSQVREREADAKKKISSSN
jgi:hypothetical protein